MKLTSPFYAHCITYFLKLLVHTVRVGSRGGGDRPPWSLRK